MTAVGRDKTFLNYFYDLASEDKSVRLNAANLLVVHIRNSLKNKQPSDPEYALKRLVRGLASSREAARQGFATCLCELLTLQEMDLSMALEILDENTKLSGSLKGSEERDYMFGKLFCYLAIVRSGKIANDTTTSITILERILELHAKRGWIREVASESLLVFMSTASLETQKVALPKLTPLFHDIPMSELAAWQLMLLMGLQHLAAKSSGFRVLWEAVVVTEDMLFSLHRLDEVAVTLCAATAGYPKIHRVWDFILSQIFPMDSDRVLKTHRLKTFTSAQESNLLLLTRFIDQHLISSSKEKRSVAMSLAVTLVKLSPPEFLPIALSKSMVRSIYSARVTKKHALFQLAGSVINDFVESAVSDTQSRIALVSVLVQYGGANFDSHTSTRAVSTLLEGMTAAEIASHVQLLCNVIGNTAATSAVVTTSNKKKSVAKKQVEVEAAQEGDDEDQNESNEETQLTTITAALESLVSIAKNSRIASRADIATQVVAILVRLSCFTKGETKAYKVPAVVPASAKKSSKKQRKGSDLESDNESAAVTAVSGQNVYPNVSCVDSIRLTETVLNNEAVSEEVAELASVKLLALLADLGTQTVQQLNKPPSAVHNSSNATEPAADREVDKTPSLLQVAWNTLTYIKQSKGLELRSHVANDVSEDVQEDEGEVTTPAQFIAEIESAIKSNKSLLTTSVESSEQKGSNNRVKLVDALNTLLLQSAFHSLTSIEIDFQTVKDVAAMVPKLLSADNSIKETKESVDSDDEDNEEEDEVDPLLPFFESCMDMLSMPSEHAIKGLRDSIKRVWTCLLTIQGDDLSIDVIDSVISAVIGDDADEVEGANGGDGDDEGEDENNGDDDSEVDDDNEDADEGEEEEGSDEESVTAAEVKNGKKNVVPPVPSSAKKGKKDNKSSSVAVTVTEKETEEEDVVLSEDQALDLLAENADDMDDEEFEANMQSMGLQHSADHDDALAQMIALRKQHRKAGLLQARRRQMLIRSRAIDILEIIINRVELGDLLYPMYLPLLKCLTRCKGSTLTQSLAEGKSYTHRLSAVIEQKLCKKRCRLIGDGDESAETAIIEESTLLLAHITKMLVSAHTPIRQIAHICLLSVSRAIILSDCEQAKTLLIDSVKPLFTIYCTKKNHRIPAKLVDDLLLNRFTDFFTPVLIAELVSHIAASTQTFTRSELCRILCALLKKYNGMTAECKEVVQTSVISMINALNTAVQAIANDVTVTKDKKEDSVVSSNNSLSTKRFKPVLMCIKEVLEFVKRNNNVDTKASQQKDKKVTVLSSIQQLRSTLLKHHDEHSKSNSPVVVKLVEQIATLTASLQTTVNSSSNGSSTNNSDSNKPVVKNGNNGNTKSNKSSKDNKDNSNNIDVEMDLVDDDEDDDHKTNNKKNKKNKRKHVDAEDAAYDAAERAAHMTVESNNRKKPAVKVAEEEVYIVPTSTIEQADDSKKVKKQKKEKK